MDSDPFLRAFILYFISKHTSSCVVTLGTLLTSFLKTISDSLLIMIRFLNWISYND